MRIIPGAELTRILNGTGRWIFRVEVRRRGDTAWTNLSAATDWALSIRTAGESPDQPVDRFTVAFVRRAGTRSLAPGISGDAFNRTAAGVFVPLLGPRSQIRVDAANLVRTDSDSAAVWRRWLEGDIEDVEWPGDSVTCSCLSLDGLLHRTQIEVEETRGAPEPGIPIGTEMQGLLNRWLGVGVVSLRVPVSPGSGVGEYIPSGSLGEQLRILAQQIGWDVRYRWSEADSAYRLTFYQPPRAKTAYDLILSTQEVLSVETLQTTPRWLRNAFALEYLDYTLGRRVTRTRENPASIASFRREWMGISEPDNSPIDTAAEAEQLLAFMDSDLSRPITDKYIRIPFLPWAELHDHIATQADDARFDYGTAWSVTGLSHQVGADERSTRLELRGGKPVGQYLAWHAREQAGQRIADTEIALFDFRETERTADVVSFAWTPSPVVDEVRVREGQYREPVATNAFPGPETGLVVLGHAERSYSARVPDPGHVTYLQFEPRHADGRTGAVVRITITPGREDLPLGPAPRITSLLVQNVGIGRAHVYAAIQDPIPRGGIMYAWVQSHNTESPDPFARADGSASLSASQAFVGPDTPFGTESGAVNLLNNIPYHPGATKQVYLEYVTLDGRTSGSVPITLLTAVDQVIDARGKLRAGSIHESRAFAANMRPFERVAVLPATGSFQDGDRIFLTSDSQTYVLTGSVWVVDPNPQQFGYHPHLNANTVRAVALNADVGDFVAVIAEVISADTVEARTLTAIRAQINTLSGILDPESGVPLGLIVSGKLQNEAGTAIFDLDAVADEPILQVGNSLVITPNSSTFSGSAPAAVAEANAYTDQAVVSSSSGAGNLTISATSAPTTRPGGTALAVGDRWVKSNSGNLPHAWNGTAWTREYTQIHGGNLITGTITADQARFTSGQGGIEFLAGSQSLATLSPLVSGGRGGANLRPAGTSHGLLVMADNAGTTSAELTADFITLGGGVNFRPFLHGDKINGFNVDFRRGAVHQVRLVGQVQFFLNFPKDGGVYRIVVQQDATGGHTVVFSAREYFPDGTPVQPSPNAHTITVYEYQYMASLDIFLVHALKRNVRALTGTTAPAPSGPTSAPSGLSLVDTSFCVGGSPKYEISFSFTSSDQMSGTEYRLNNVLRGTLDPGVRSGVVLPDTAGEHVISIRHIRNGITSSTVSATVFLTNPCTGAVLT